MYYQKYDYIGTFLRFLIAIFVAEMYNGWYCLYRNWNENIFYILQKNFFFSSSLMCYSRERERKREREREREREGDRIRSTWKDSRYVNIILAFRSWSARTVPMINQMCSRVVHTCSWNTTAGRQREARSGAVHDKVDLFFSHPTPGLTRGWTRCFNILIGRRNGRFRDLAFYNDILPAFRS